MVCCDGGVVVVLARLVHLCTKGTTQETNMFKFSIVNSLTDTCLLTKVTMGTYNRYCLNMECC